ncbi:MAG: DIP1984 family protein [Anaerolineae bacterium]
MKLAEALILRADTQKRIEQLRQRLARNARVQEGDQPAEEPQTLLAELEHAATQLTDLVQRINRTNTVTELEAGLSLSDALAHRDTLTLRQSVYKSLAAEAVVTQNRYSNSELRYTSTVNVAAIQRVADDLARERRELDTRIQSLNWQVDLLE